MAFLVAFMIFMVSVAGLLHVLLGVWARPMAISSTASAVDAQFLVTMITTGVAFVATQGFLLFYVLRYTGKRPGKARMIAGNRTFEIIAMVLCSAVFLFLAVSGQGAWARMLRLTDADPLVVQVLGEQFVWNVRYAGADGQFGTIDPTQYDSSFNPFGNSASDASAADDVVLLNELRVPVGRTVLLEMQAKDVIHSLFIPALRIKQDLVPGLITKLSFRAERVGEYEIACAELCGLGHYRMRGVLRVVEPQAFEQWMREQQ